MEFRILGLLEVCEGGHPLPLGGTKQRALLAILVLRANEVVSTDRLIDELWGERPPGHPAKIVHVYVSRLRKALAAAQPAGGRHSILVTRPPGYLLQVGPGELDLERFEALLAEGRRALAAGAPDQAAARLREALALWRGPALADFAYEPFAQAAIDRLEELRLGALEERIEADLALGRHSELVGELEQLVAAHPLRERLRGQLILALYRSGRQAEALQAYQKARQALVEELGIDPSPALQRLEKAILVQDPALEGSVAAPVPSAPVPAAAPDSPELEPLAPRALRKTITVVFAEVWLADQRGLLDPEAESRLSARLLGAVARALERHGGAVERLPGGLLMAIFGMPVVHEDDALRALRAAVEAREALVALAAELEREAQVRTQLRVGVNTGQALVGSSDGRSLAAGQAVILAARLQRAAAPGEILLGEDTELVVRHALRSEPVEAAVEPAGRPIRVWRLLELISGAQATVRRLEAPMVGREHELAQLLHTFERSVRERACQLFTLLGVAGIGKSRLVHEFRAGVTEKATVLSGRCLPYGEGITFWPVVEVVRQAAGIAPEDPPEAARARLAALVEGVESGALVAERIAQLIGLAEGGAAEESFWAARRLLEALARRAPLVVVFDDVNWGEPTFIDLVEHVVDWARDAPILLVCVARPELLDLRPAWGGGKPNATSLTLEPLSESESDRLIRNLLGRATLAEGVRARIAEAAEGNPLFIEEMLSLLIEERLLRRENGRWEASAELARVPVPTSIQALLAARLDLLGADERRVLERAALEGKVFRRRAVQELCPEQEPGRTAACLLTLVRKDLVRPEPASVGEDAFRFRHMLVREAAYQAIPKQTRAELHERFADWLERTASARLREVEEIVGYHLEQAYRYRAELGPVDEEARSLAARAAHRLEAAGRRALARSDLPAAINLLERAASLLPEDEPARWALLPELGAALTEAGRLAAADRVLVEAVGRASAAGDERLESHAVVQRLFLRLQVDTEAATAEARRVVERVLLVFEQHGDDLGLCRLWRLQALVHWIEARCAAADEAWQRAAELARRAGDERELADVLCWLASSALFGPIPAPAGIRRCEEIREQVRSNRRAEALTLHPLAGLYAMTGRFDTARELLRRSNAILEDLGLTMSSAVSHPEGLVAMLAGDPAGAEQCLRSGYARLEEMGEKALLSTTAALLAEAICAQGRYEEAERFAEASAETGARDDLTAQIIWRRVRAKILARQGHLEEAERLARAAVTLAGQTDWLSYQGDALLDLAEVLETAGRLEEARAAIRDGLRLYEQKGNLAAAAKAHSELARLVPA